MDLYVAVVLAALILLASVISVELGLSAAIIEITLGVIGGNFLGLQQLECGEVRGLIDQAQFSVLVASAIVPTYFAQRFFHPHHALEAMGGEVEPELLEPPA